ncbi:YraN family protein [Desulfobacca acetoxidans]|uniref:UPF0102 protein Desac_0749 n=1 Tax=Desulfobacca acetoxidans (strain ATCC 700848 / DSM 11109 / ASRB2) TaxID=880072 RepID=F2NF73_DESAR|nr:YraN family protein [Desulfobacca acetoxidans]AEB08628.1 UPF0102 protein yraN [Desulfobacca acetoxidans DSM 11109]HAY23426.1 YraN family protein [Desulfobacterales bacterium]
MTQERRLLGQMGEALAADVLKESGYNILARNYRTPFGEIDLIARHQDTLVFIEVKLRRSRIFGPPQAAITPNKQRHVRLAAQYYLQGQRTLDAKVRFDVVAITLEKNSPQIEIFSEAF